jgi:hypothetical protein
MFGRYNIVMYTHGIGSKWSQNGLTRTQRYINGLKSVLNANSCMCNGPNYEESAFTVI